MQYLYKITNKINNKSYIGRTENIHKRWLRHISELNSNKHHCLHLQRAWNKYGQSNFEFSIILEVETFEEITKLEEYYINKDFDNLYNVSKKSDGGDLLSYHPNKEEIRSRIIDSNKKYWDNISDEDYQTYCEKYIGENNPNYKHGKYTKEAMKKRSEEWAKLTEQEKHARYGHEPWNKGLKTGPLSEETKKKMRESSLGKGTKKILCNNILFNSLNEAQEYLEVSLVTIHNRLNSNNFNYKYFNENEDTDYIEFSEENMPLILLNLPKGKTYNKKVYCEGIIFHSILAAKEYYGFNSSNAITYRCESKAEKWKDFYFI